MLFFLQMQVHEKKKYSNWFHVDQQQLLIL